MNALLTGVLAGYGIAIPVGAIAILIVETAMRRGFPWGASAGAGAASADLLYAGLAVIGGTALVSTMETFETGWRVPSALILAIIAVVGLIKALGRPKLEQRERSGRQALAGTYLRFLGLTLINPTTVVYFGAVIVGLGVAADMTPLDGALFTFGAGLASLSWQLTLAGIGAFAGVRLGNRARIAAVVAGNLLILVLALVIAFR